MNKILLSSINFLLCLSTWACPSPHELKALFKPHDGFDVSMPVNYNLEKHVMEYVFIFEREHLKETKVLLISHIEGQEMENIDDKIPSIMNHLVLQTPQPIPFHVTPQFSIGICAYQADDNPNIKGSYFSIKSPENKTQLMQTLGFKSRL